MKHNPTAHNNPGNENADLKQSQIVSSGQETSDILTTRQLLNTLKIIHPKQGHTKKQYTEKLHSLYYFTVFTKTNN